MKKLLQINVVVLILFISALSVFGQSSAKIEKDLVASIQEIKKYSNYGSSYDDEKLSRANEVFKEKLLKYTKIAATLKYQFTELDKLMQNATSADGRFRIYSWDTEQGGTMHDYDRVYQYLGANGKIYSKTDEVSEEDGGNMGSFVYDIFTLETKGGKIYIVCSTFIGSTNDHYQSASLYEIVGAKLDDNVKLIKTTSGLTNSLGFEYNFFSVVDREERPIKLILFDQKTKTLKIPIVINDQEFPNGRVTNKFISYKFKGTNFVKIK